MAATVKMTFRVDRELRDAFVSAASREGRPAAQVLREFMQLCVQQARAGREPPVDEPMSPV